MSRPDPPGRIDRFAIIALFCAGRTRTNLHTTRSQIYSRPSCNNLATKPSIRTISRISSRIF